MSEFHETAGNHVCIVGAGPAGALLALLLVRQGIPVTLLEAQSDFDRDFRGDTLHASSLEILAQIDLIEPVLKLCHSKVEKFQLTTINGNVAMADFSALDTPFPYIALIPQEKFLHFITEEAKKYAEFRLLMNAKFHELIIKDNLVCGVEYIKDGITHKMPAYLTVGADGRGSRVREKAGFKLEKTSPPMDVLWFKLPRSQEMGPENQSGGRFGAGHIVAILDRGNVLQMGYVILKGSYKALREQGISILRDELLKLLPQLGNSVQTLKDWSQCAILSVVTGRVKKWYRPGLLLIGDAAHVMSPVGGVGINYAIQDAVAAANVLSSPLQQNSVSEMDLAEVQLRRERSVRFIQSIQSIIQKSIIGAALKSDKPFSPPLLIRFLTKFAFFRKTIARIMAYGIHPEKLKYY